MSARALRSVFSLLLVPCLLCSCGLDGRDEPEQVYTVSAVGFDGVGDRIRLTVEVPLSRESDTQSMETKLFLGEGRTVEEALRSVTVGLARELSFAHCALMVLGESLSAEQTDAVFSFAEKGESIPIAAEVVATPNAEDLLAGGSLSAPAAGYDIPSILREIKDLIGVETRSRIYELRAHHSENAPTVLPYFSAAREEDARTAVFEGLALLQRGKPTVYLDVTESVWYAVLCDRFCGTGGALGVFGDVEIERVRSELTVEPTSPVTFVLTLRMRASKAGNVADLQSAEQQIKQAAEALFVSLRTRAGGDVFGFRERAKSGPSEWQEGDCSLYFADAVLRVNCKIEGARGRS